jgi:uncharacterized membrane protein
MTYQTSRLLRAFVVIIVAVLVGWSVYAGNPWIPVPAVVVGAVIIALFKRGVKEIVTDERIYSVADKAGVLTFRVFAMLGAVTGTTLLAISRDSNPDFEQAGFALTYSVCAMLIIYLISFTVYNRMHGGKE